VSHCGESFFCFLFLRLCRGWLEGFILSIISHDGGGGKCVAVAYLTKYGAIQHLWLILPWLMIPYGNN